jgi:uncharacterized protein YneF (UPF0154 family)
MEVATAELFVRLFGTPVSIFAGIGMGFFILIRLVRFAFRN